MDARQTAFDIASRGGTVEALDGDRMVVSSGTKPNHLLHFFMGLLTFGAWWLVVWLPVCVAGGRKRRVIVAGTREGDRRLPHELPWTEFMVITGIFLPFILIVCGVPFIFVVIIVMGGASALRSIANSR